MTGMKIAAGVAFVSGGMAPMLSQISVDPSSLQGLEPVALATVISLSALAVVCYFIRSLVPAINANTMATTVTNERIHELCARIDRNPCMAVSAADARREALAVVDEAQRNAKAIVADAAREALKVVEEAKKGVGK